MMASLRNYRACWIDHEAQEETNERLWEVHVDGDSSRPETDGRGGRLASRPRVLLAVCFLVVVEREVVEVRGRSVSLQVDGGLGAVLRDERVAVELGQRGREHRADELPDGGPHGSVASG